MEQAQQTEPQQASEETRAAKAATPSRRYQVCFLSGTGLGPELIAHAHRALEALGQVHGFAVDAEHAPFAAEGLHRHGRALPEETRRRCAAADAVLVGAHDPALAVLVAAVAASPQRSLGLGPRGAWLSQHDDGAAAHVWSGQTIVVSIDSEDDVHLAGYGVADPRPALEASCLMLEALGESAAAATLAAALHLPRGVEQSPEETVSTLLASFANDRADVELRASP